MCIRDSNELGWKAETRIEDTLLSAWKWQLKLRERGIPVSYTHLDVYKRQGIGRYSLRVFQEIRRV